MWKIFHAIPLLLLILSACSKMAPSPIQLPSSETTPLPTTILPSASPAPYATEIPSPAPPTMTPLPTASFPLTEALAIVIVVSDPYSSTFQLAALQPNGTLHTLPISFLPYQLTPSRTWLIGTTEIHVTENGQENTLAALNLSTGQVQTTDLMPNYWIGKQAQSIEPMPNYWISNLAIGPDDQVAFVEWDYPAANHWRIVHVSLNNGWRTTLYEGQDECHPAGWCLPRVLGWSDQADEVIVWGFLQGTEDICTSPLQAINTKTGQVRQILCGLTANIARLSPDGIHLVYSSYNPDYPPDNYVPGPGTPSNNELYSLDLATVQSTLLLSEQSGRIFTSNPIFSADGRHVLMWRGHYRSGEPGPPRSEELIVVSIESGAVTIVETLSDTVRPYGEPAPCSDGGFLYTVCSSNYACELRRVPANLQQATPLPYRFDTRIAIIACLQ